MNMPRDLDPSVVELLATLRPTIERQLGDGFIGLYMYGSAVYGGFTPFVSDVDLLAVAEGPLAESDLPGLRAMHAEVLERHPAWQDRIEVAYQSREGLRTYMHRSAPMGIISPGEPLHRIQAGRDWRINWFFVLDHGVTLAGPPPQTLIAPLPLASFLDASRELGLAMLERIQMAAPGAVESYTVLTACRALMTQVTRRPVSKQAAAAWTAERMPEWAPLIEWALRVRLRKGEVRATTGSAAPNSASQDATTPNGATDPLVTPRDPSLQPDTLPFLEMAVRRLSGSD